MLTVTGEAEGPTREFLAFIEKSPVNGMIDHFTDSWQAQGSGKLTLKLELPLRATEKGQVAGAYQFAGNTVVADPDLPADRAGERARRVHRERACARRASPARSSAARSRSPPARRRTAPLRINAQGRVSADNVRRAGNVPPWLQGMRGATDWRATLDRAEARVRLRDRIRPAGTGAGPAGAARQGCRPTRLPLRYERRSAGQNQERLTHRARRHRERAVRAAHGGQAHGHSARHGALRRRRAGAGEERHLDRRGRENARSRRLDRAVRAPARAMRAWSGAASS